MCGNLPPYIDKGAQNLYYECRHEYVAHEVGYVEAMHYIVTHKVAYNRKQIWHYTTFLLAKLDECPSVIAAIEMDEQCGQENGEKVDKTEYRKLVRPWHQTEIAEREQRYQSDKRQIEWRKYHAKNAGSDNNILFFHIS